MRQSALIAAVLFALVPAMACAQATVPESALTGPVFSLPPQTAPSGQASGAGPRGPNQNVLGNSGVPPAPPLTGPHVAPGTPGALIPKRPLAAAPAGDPVFAAYVRSLQERLPAHGYRPGAVTGRLDPATERAIQAYQRDAGIPPNARSTWVLKQTLDSVNFARPPIRAAHVGREEAGGGDTIAFVQRALAAKGYDPGPADGRLGGRTESAIKAFEGDRGLPRDGKVGPQLLELLGRT